MHRTAEFIEETKAQAEQRATEQPQQETPEKPAKRHKSGFRGPSPDVGKPYRWQPGCPSPNPTGRPKRDIAADIARAVFETSENDAIRAFQAALLKGNAYTFKELAERAYGKLQERKEVTHIHQEVPDADLNKRITDLVRDLGLAKQIEEAGASIAAGGEGKTNGESKDTPVLS
jgi:hypothetical protein